MFPPIAFIFPGQGAQTVGMGSELRDASPASAALFAKANSTLGRDLTKVMWEGPKESLTRTGNCQPALYLHGLVALAALREALAGRAAEFDDAVVGAAGLSLGELTALSLGRLIRGSYLSEQTVELENGETCEPMEVLGLAAEFGDGYHALSLPLFRMRSLEVFGGLVAQPGSVTDGPRSACASWKVGEMARR